MKLAKIALSALLSATALAAAGDASAQGRLNLYCSVQEDWCQLMQTEFEKATGVRVAMTRKSSGETYARIRAEKDNPQESHWNRYVGIRTPSRKRTWHRRTGRGRRGSQAPWGARSPSAPRRGCAGRWARS